LPRTWRLLPFEEAEQLAGLVSDVFLEAKRLREGEFLPLKTIHSVHRAPPGVDLLVGVTHEDALSSLGQQDTQHGRVGILRLVKEDHVVG
jgi:hypothetical protein